MVHNRLVGNKLEIICKTCKSETLTVDLKKVERVVNGEMVQNVFPELSPDERELIISGICGSCFDRMFGEG